MDWFDVVTLACLVANGMFAVHWWTEHNDGMVLIALVGVVACVLALIT